MNISEIINQNTNTLVDVREMIEFQSVHPEGAINIPLGTIPNQLDEFRKMSKPIVVYCASGNRSSQAMNYLKAQGFEEVYNGGGVLQVMGMQQLKTV